MGGGAGAVDQTLYTGSGAAASSPPEAARIEQIKDKYLRSQVIDGRDGEIRKTNPEEFIAWTLSMGDPELRSETFGKLTARPGAMGRIVPYLETLLQNGKLIQADRQVIEARLSGN